jgi:phosphoribosyl 1,2-cyclic phosphodiesterase
MIGLEVLASGSRGNAALLTLASPTGEETVLMIDAGLSPRRTRRALEARGRSHQCIAGVLLTHGDGDHLHAGWAKAIDSWDFKVFTHASHAASVQRSGIPSQHIHAFEREFAFGDTHIETAMAPHDTHGTVVYAVRHHDAVVAWATDLGRIDAALTTFLRSASPHILGIESNYDRSMQARSGRPLFLIDRITGGWGHLSNAQAVEIAVELHESAPLQHVVLLHRSEQCNCPRVIESLWRDRAPHLIERVTIASQHEATKPMAVTLDRCPA